MERRPDLQLHQVVTQPKKEVKEEKPTKATTSKTAKPVTKAASSTNVKAKPRKRVITSDNEDGDETDKSPAPVAQASGSKSTVLGPTSSTARADDAAAMEAMMAMDMDNDSDLEEALRGGSSAPAKKTAAVKAVKRESSTTKTGGARKKRKVKRSVTEMNDKGYMGEPTIGILTFSADVHSHPRRMDRGVMHRRVRRRDGQKVQTSRKTQSDRRAAPVGPKVVNRRELKACAVQTSSEEHRWRGEEGRTEYSSWVLQEKVMMCNPAIAHSR